MGEFVKDLTYELVHYDPKTMKSTDPLKWTCSGCGDDLTSDEMGSHALHIHHTTLYTATVKDDHDGRSVSAHHRPGTKHPN